MPSQERRRSFFAGLVDQVRAETVAAFSGDHAAGHCLKVQTEGYDLPPPPRYFFDASPLFRRMDMLQIDRNEFAKEDPLLFRELQGICALCHGKEGCWRELGRELGDEFDDAQWQNWSTYCPNSALLLQIAAVHSGASADAVSVDAAGEGLVTSAP